MFRFAKYIIIFFALFAGFLFFDASAPAQAQVCGSTKGACESGVLDDNGVYDSGSSWTWDCVEESAGITRSCSVAKGTTDGDSGDGSGAFLSFFSFLFIF